MMKLKVKLRLRMRFLPPVTQTMLILLNSNPVPKLEMKITLNPIRILRNQIVIKLIQRQVLSQHQCQRSRETKPKEDGPKDSFRSLIPPPP